MQALSFFVLLLAVPLAGPAAACPAPPAERPAGTATKKVVFIAGEKSHGPGEHEYEKGLKLLQSCLDSAPGPKARTELHLDGWPRDPRTLDDADTIVLYCDGSDRKEDAHPLLRGDHLQVIERQMARGCGLVAIHYTVFVPSAKAGERFLEWIGGYFDYQSGPGPNHWYSAIGTHETQVAPAAPDHPICRGWKPYRLKEEFYYHLRFREGDPRLRPILTAEIPGRPAPEVVAFAVERAGGGRGFGFTGGHFHSNWSVESFRRMVLNAILWTAHLEVPPGGV
jgi:type 1 glutamine amidotransferase